MKNKKIILIILILLVSLNPIYAKEKVKLSRCVDGDTFRVLINEEEFIVRMLAIDTPESVKANNPIEYYGKESSEYTCQKLTNAKKIELEYDENSDKTDKYDRLLAWVFVDNKLLQADLIENGYAKVAYLYDDYKYANELKKLQELASANELGVWNEEAQSNYQEDSSNIENVDSNNKKNSLEDIIIGVITAIILGIIALFKKKKAK